MAAAAARAAWWSPLLLLRSVLGPEAVRWLRTTVRQRRARAQAEL